MTEDDLADCLRRGRSVILIGHPTEGKTRTSPGAPTTGWPRRAPDADQRAPPHTGLGSLRGRRTIVLFDDLNDYAHVWPQVRDLLDSVKEHAATVTYASTCRGGRELRAVREAIDSGLARFFEDSPSGYVWSPRPTTTRPHSRRASTGPGTTGQAEQFPTLGSVAMSRRSGRWRPDSRPYPPKHATSCAH